MKKPFRNRALLFVLPALLIMMFSFVMPIMVVINYSVQDVFSGNNYWCRRGLCWNSA